MDKKETGFWNTPLTSSLVRSQSVKLPEMLLGYFIGPFGALLSSGIFTSILQNYFTDVLKLDLGFLTGLQLFSTILIVAANLVVGQLIERTKALAGKARPWVLLSALTLSVASVLMFIVPFQSPAAKMMWIAIAYNLYYAVAYPIYNTANSTLIPVSTRDSKQRATLASFTNVAGLGVMGVGSMVFPMLVSFALKENQGLWFMTMLAVAIFTALTIYLQFKFTRERVTEESMGTAGSDAQAKTATLGEQLKAVTSEKWWWITVIFYICFQWSGAMKNGSMAFFCKWVLDNTFFGSADAWGASQSLLAVLGAIPMAVAANLTMMFGGEARVEPGRVAVKMAVSFFILGSVLYLFYKKKGNKTGIRLILLLGSVVLVRYMVLSNHSYLHEFFTYRALMSPVLAVFLSLALSMELPVFVRRKRSGRRGKTGDQRMQKQ